MDEKITQVLVKPAGADCNLSCDYCFYLCKTRLYPDATRRMTTKVQDELIRQSMQDGGEVVAFSWQGGEPTLMGLAFFQRAFQLQKKYAKPRQAFVNTIQTNGLLLDDAWCSFLARHRYLVGLSIDGTEQIHNAYRKDKGGCGSWDKVVEAVHLLGKHHVDTNALIMVTNKTQGKIKELWENLLALGLFHFQFIHCLERDNAGWRSYSILPEAYGEILCELFELWLQEFDHGMPRVFVRFFDALLFSYIGKRAPLCTIAKHCGDGVVVEHNGDVYSCDFFVEPEHKLGNLLDTPLKQLIFSKKQADFGSRKAGLCNACKHCEWQAHCHGGCPKDRRNNPANPGMDPLCESYRTFFAKADPYLTKIAQTWLRSC